MPNEYKLLSDGSWAMQVQIAGTSSDSSSSGALGVNVKAAEAIVPIDVQRHFTEVVQTHNAVVVGASGVAWGNYILCDGYDEITVLFRNSATAPANVDIRWSLDGVNEIGLKGAIITGTQQSGVPYTTPVQAPYVMLATVNSDTVSRTHSAWIYMKA